MTPPFSTSPPSSCANAAAKSTFTAKSSSNSGAVTEDIIINMCRELRSIDLLQKREDAGALVINSGYGIENCTRERMTRILLGSNIPHPDSLMVNTDEAIKDNLIKAGITRCWIKRGDFHAMHKEDVSYARHPEEAQEVLQEYFLRGIKRAVINRHLEGDLLKFYGVCDTPFFYWFFPFKSPQTEGAAAEKAPAGFNPDYFKEHLPPGGRRARHQDLRRRRDTFARRRPADNRLQRLAQLRALPQRGGSLISPSVSCRP